MGPPVIGAVANRLRDGRLHLNHGPIDLIVSADGVDRTNAFKAAELRFETLLFELVSELPCLRKSMCNEVLYGKVALKMQNCARAHHPNFITPMAAVAGAVADEILSVLEPFDLTRAAVNNGGDIALFLGPNRCYTSLIAGPDGANLGRIQISQSDAPRGIATSGQGGRSLSRGIADAVTVLARTAAQADAAATMIANVVDLPDGPKITRTPADTLDPDSDLGTRLVVTKVPILASYDIDRALLAGLTYANELRYRGVICGAALFLQGRAIATASDQLTLTQRSPVYA